jgi:hypothetical protein
MSSRVVGLGVLVLRVERNREKQEKDCFGSLRLGAKKISSRRNTTLLCHPL